MHLISMTLRAQECQYKPWSWVVVFKILVVNSDKIVMPTGSSLVLTLQLMARNDWFWFLELFSIIYQEHFVRSLFQNAFFSYVLISEQFKEVPPPWFLPRDCTRSHPEKKYRSYKVNFWQKSLMYQDGISRMILWELLFLANCIVRNQQL